MRWIRRSTPGSGRERDCGKPERQCGTRSSIASRAHAGERWPRFSDTSVRFNCLPVIRARVALNRGYPPEAIKLLQAAVPFGPGGTRSSISGLFGALYPVYVRREACLAAHQGPKAPPNFRKFPITPESSSVIP
jgi:hypothetical protein